MKRSMVVAVAVLVGAMVAACTPPSGEQPSDNGAIELEQGRPAINRSSVQLKLTVPAGATAVRIANGADPSDGPWVSIDAVRTWQLDPGDGPRTVSAQFSRGGSIASVISDTILVDTVPPVVSIDSHHDGQSVDLSGGEKQVLGGHVSDPGSGVAATTLSAAGNPVEVGLKGDDWAAPLGAAQSGRWSYAVTAVDVAGNSASTAVELDVVVPPHGVTVVRPGVLDLDRSALRPTLRAGSVTTDALAFDGDQRAALTGIDVIVSSPIDGITDAGLLRLVDGTSYDPVTGRTTISTSPAGIFDVYAQLGPGALHVQAPRSAQRSAALDDRCSELANQGAGASVKLPDASVTFPIPFPGPSNFAAGVAVDTELAANLDMALSFDVGWTGIDIKEFRAIAGVLLCGTFDLGVSGDIENALGPQFGTGVSEHDYSARWGIKDISVLTPALQGKLRQQLSDLIHDIPPIQLGTLPIWIRPTVGLGFTIDPTLSVGTSLRGTFVAGGRGGVRWDHGFKPVLDPEFDADFDAVSAAADASLKVGAGPEFGVTVNESLPIQLLKASVIVGPQIDVSWAADRIAADSSITSAKAGICVDLLAELGFHASISVGRFRLNLIDFKLGESRWGLGCPYSKTFTGDLVVTPPDPPPARVGTAYGPIRLVANHPSTWTVVQGSLPPGLRLSPSGIIDGVPTAAGTSTVTIRARDALRQTSEVSVRIVVTGVGVYHDLVVASKPMAYWSMQDDVPAGNFTAKDVVGSFDAAATNVAPSATGPFPGSRSFEFRGNGWLAVPNAASFAKDAFSIETWVRVDAPPSNSDDSVSSLFRSRTFGYALNVTATTGQPTFWAWNNTGLTSPVSITSPPGTWHHLVGTRDSTGSRLYVDGVMVSENPTVAPIQLFGSAVGIGRDADHPTDYLNGAMAHVAFYDRALSADEVAQHASAR